MIDTANHDRIDLRALRALVAVADRGSFRAAAAALGYTQSAISHRIAALEGALGAQLFTRPGGRGAISLTPAGDAAYRRARRVLAEVETLGADVAAIKSGQRRVLRVGTFQAATNEVLPAALRVLRTELPDVEVVLTEHEETSRTFDRLADGRLDLAFLINPVGDERVESFPLLEDPWVIVTRRDSDLAIHPDPSFDLLDGRDVIAWTRRWLTQVRLEEAWRRRGIAPRVVFRTDDNLALQRLVAAGFGDAVLDRLTAAGAVEPSLTWVAPREILIPRVIALCRPRRRELSAAAQTLLEAVRSQYGA